MPSIIEMRNIILTNLSLCDPKPVFNPESTKIFTTLSSTAIENSFNYLNLLDRADLTETIADDFTFQLTTICKASLSYFAYTHLMRLQNSEFILQELSDKIIFRIWHDLLYNAGFFATSLPDIASCNVVIWLCHLQQFAINPSEKSFRTEGALANIIQATNNQLKKTGKLTQTQFHAIEDYILSKAMTTLPAINQGLSSCSTPIKQPSRQRLTVEQCQTPGPI